MKNKPEKYGMKLYIASDPLTVYTLRFEIYSGKGEENYLATNNYYYNSWENQKISMGNLKISF